MTETVATGGRALPPPSGPIHRVRLTDAVYRDAFELGMLRRRYLELRPTARDEQRMVAYLVDVQGLKLREVGAVMGTTYRTAKTHLVRWRALARRGAGVAASQAPPASDPRAEGLRDPSE